jgi:hypothetical protein
MIYPHQNREQAPAPPAEPANLVIPLDRFYALLAETWVKDPIQTNVLYELAARAGYEVDEELLIDAQLDLSDQCKRQEDFEILAGIAAQGSLTPSCQAGPIICALANTERDYD